MRELLVELLAPPAAGTPRCIARWASGEIGHLLSCQRDATFCEGYDKRLRLTRTQTIMQGASHCDFNYKLVDNASQS